MEPARPIALFVTCLVDQLMPEIGVATVRLLRRAGFQVDFPAEQTCCGQPFFNSGFRREASSLAMRTIEVFEDQEAVVLPSGSCTAMIRKEYPHLLSEHEGWEARTQDLAERTFELSEFLVHQTDWSPGAEKPPEIGERTSNIDAQPADNILAGNLSEPGVSASNTIAYHDSCHMCRLLGLREEPRRLLVQSGCSLREMEESDRCCGFGGLFSLRMPEISTTMTAEKIRLAAASEAATIVTADPGCLMQMRELVGAEGPKIEHLALVLERMTR